MKSPLSTMLGYCAKDGAPFFCLTFNVQGHASLLQDVA